MQTRHSSSQKPSADWESRRQALKRRPISLSEVVQARSVIYKHLKPSPLIRYDSLSDLLDADIYVKHENHNPTRSFKIRGGINLAWNLKQQKINGVITFSTGNHGLSIATAAALFGIQATILIPEGGNPQKAGAIKKTGAELIQTGRSLDDAAELAAKLCGKKGVYDVHPANEPLLINGVGTLFYEIFEDLSDIDVVIVPIGAGSEAAAAATVFQSLSPRIEIIAVQAACSPAAYKSWRERRICSEKNSTFAGGLATGRAYETTFSIYKDALTDFILLSEEELHEAMALAISYTGNLAESAGAASIIAALKIRDRLRGKKVVLQMSGGNASDEEIGSAITRASLMGSKNRISDIVSVSSSL